MAGGADGTVTFSPSQISLDFSELSIGREYRLGRLAILERDLYRVESRYLDKSRLDPQAMFDGALDRVQRQYPEVLFVQPETSGNLHVSVGSFSTVMRVGALRGFDALYEQLLRVSVILDDHLSDEIDRREVEYALVNGMLSSLDPHTVLLPPAAARDMEVDNKGEFGGLGIEISTVDGQLVVKVPLEDTPAFRAGLKPDDRIVRIEGESTINIDLDDAVSKLRGMVGDPVTIMVMRKGWSAPKAFTIVREKIRINPLEGELLEGDVGYIRIKSFNARAAQDLEANLARFRRETTGSLRGLVLDLRMNPGGFLNQAINVADKFISEGVLVATEEGATGERAEQRATRNGTEPDYPVVVLVNASSASASEIVAGAIRNQNRGVVIGERTFGKGSIQHLYPHEDDSRLKLTVGRYLTPGDRSIQAVGVTPDIRLVPSLIEAADSDAEPDPWGLAALPQISLYGREWVDREDSLDRSFQKVASEVEKPVYELRYHYEFDEDDVGRGVDPKTDWEVQFAREVIVAAASSRRADMLRTAAQVVKKFDEDQSLALESAFGAVGLDWSTGRNAEKMDLVATLDLGDDDQLTAGEHENIGVTITNNGPEPAYRISAVTESENPWLDKQEFFFGMIPPGESRTFHQRLALHGGYPSTDAEMKVSIQDPQNHSVSSQSFRVRTKGKELPVLAYQINLSDGVDGKGKGNANRVPEVGETIVLAVSVTNQGPGPTQDAFVRVKNRSGSSVDLGEGGFAVGDWRNRTGEACEELSAGCAPVLDAGDTFTGELVFDLRSAPKDAVWELDVWLGDNRAYDFSVVRSGGFYDFFQQEESLSLDPKTEFVPVTRKPPTIEVTKRPAAVISDGFVVISGVARTDGRAKDIMVYHGEDKIFYEGGTGEAGLRPFTVERKLSPGAHSFYILVRDENGLTASESVHVWAEEA